MKLNFIKTNPTENMTVFISDPLPRQKYIEIANHIMDYNHIHAEQVGFIENISSQNSQACVRLHMMGGEFCVNATRSLAAILVQRQHCKIQKKEEKYIVPLEVSGLDELVFCEVELNNQKNDMNSFISTAKISSPQNIEDFSINYNNTTIKGKLVEFPGITHLVVNDNKIDSKKISS